MNDSYIALKKEKKKKGIIEPFYGHFKINYEKMVISSY
jgi:hypothetical protein